MSRTFILKALVLATAFAIVLFSCQQNDLGTGSDVSGSLNNSQPLSTQKAENAHTLQGFTHGIIVNIDGDDYYLAGAPDGPNGATDIPGHYWKQTGENSLIAKHINSGPFGKAQWWSSSAPDGALLYMVKAELEEWSMAIAKQRAKMGFVHYHEMVRVSDGKLHPSKVLWLKHIAVRHFYLDGGPHPEFSHFVKPGVDTDFIPNGMMPYQPE